MIQDKIVNRVRKNREKIFADFNYDMKKYSLYIIELQKNESRKLVNKKTID